jgi:hypothetical protein
MCYENIDRINVEKIFRKQQVLQIIAVGVAYFKSFFMPRQFLVGQGIIVDFIISIIQHTK